MNLFWETVNDDDNYNDGVDGYMITDANDGVFRFAQLCAFAFERGVNFGIIPIYPLAALDFVWKLHGYRCTVAMQASFTSLN